MAHPARRTLFLALAAVLALAGAGGAQAQAPGFPRTPPPAGGAAALQAQAMSFGKPVVYLEPEEARLAARTLAGTIDRPWQLWRRKALGK